jgi:hypothetical protein
VGTLSTSQWIKSSFSDTGTSCVEVRLRAEAVDVRDTKDRTRPPFRVHPGAWDAFLSGVRNREFGE